MPDGKYQVVVDKVELTEAQSTGNPMLKWTLRVIAPKYVNRLMWRNSVITQNALKYLKTDLHLCGLDLEKLSDLPKHLKKLPDVKLEVTKKTKGENENVFLTAASRTTAPPASSGRRPATRLSRSSAEPVRIVIDTRENEPYSFDPLLVTAVRRALPAGDYSIERLEAWLSFLLNDTAVEGRG